MASILQYKFKKTMFPEKKTLPLKQTTCFTLEVTERATCVITHRRGKAGGLSLFAPTSETAVQARVFQGSAQTSL